MKTKRKIKTSISSKIFDIFNYFFILFFCFTILVPLWDLIVISVSRAQDVSIVRTNIWPEVWCFDAYKYCLNTPILGTAFVNSVLRTILGSAYHLLICCLCAFSLTRNEMPFKKFFSTIFLITMFFSGGLIPTYLNLKSLKMLDTFWIYILPTGFSMYNTIIIRNYFLSIDKSLEESATIDGASMLQVMYKIILPLSTPVLATVGLWQLVGQWNAWFDNMVYVRPEKLITLQYLLRRMSVNAAQVQDEAAMTMQVVFDQTSASYTPDTIIAATTVIVLVPIMMVYPFLQRYFVKGIMLGAVKG